MALTYEPIASTTLGSSSPSIDFTSISSAYTDLRLVVFGRSSYGSTLDIMQIQMNSVTTNYSRTVNYGNGSAAGSAGSTALDYWYIHWLPANTTNSNVFGLFIIDFMNYASTSYGKFGLYKSYSAGNASTNFEVQHGVLRNSSTAAISSLKIQTQNGNVAAGTIATLFGIKRA